MATRLISRSFSLSLLNTAKQTLSRNPTVLSPPSLLLRLRPISAVSAHFNTVSPAAARSFSTRQTNSSLSDPSPNWSNRPPKETILLDGCDFEHWLVVVEAPTEPDITRDDIISSYIKTLAQVVGSEEEARMKIYSVSTKHYFAFGALVSEELSYKLKELPGVRWVLPDSYLDVRNKDYGGEPFINGEAVPYDPKYHAEWVKNNARANERNRRNDRPRNFDRSRNFERRDNMQTQNRGGFQGNQGGQSPPPNMGPTNPPSNMGPANPPPHNMGPANPPPHNMGPANPPPIMGASPRAPNMPYNNIGPNMGPNNMGPPNMRPNNMGQGPQNNMGYGANNVEGASNNMGYGANNVGGAPNNMGQGPQNMGQGPQNMGQGPQNMGYGPNNVGGAPNNGQNFQYRGGPSGGPPPQFQNNQYQNRASPQQTSGDHLHNFDPSSTAGNNAYQPQNVQGRDSPPLQTYQ